MRRLVFAILLIGITPVWAQQAQPGSTSLQNQMAQRIQQTMGNLVITNSNLQEQVQYDQNQIVSLLKQVDELKKQVAAHKQASLAPRKQATQ